MADRKKSSEQAYLECRKKIYLSIDPKNYLNLFDIESIDYNLIENGSLK